MYCSCISDEIKPDSLAVPIPLQADFEIIYPSLRLDAASLQENLKAFKEALFEISSMYCFHIPYISKIFILH